MTLARTRSVHETDTGEEESAQFRGWRTPKPVQGVVTWSSAMVGAIDRLAVEQP